MGVLVTMPKGLPTRPARKRNQRVMNFCVIQWMRTSGQRVRIDSLDREVRHSLGREVVKTWPLPRLESLGRQFQLQEHRLLACCSFSQSQLGASQPSATVAITNFSHGWRWLWTC